MNEQPRQHFQVRDAIPDNDLPPRVVHTHTVNGNPTQRYIELLWVVGAWTVIFINLLACGISMRDMFLSNYSPNQHWIMSAVFVASLGGLLAIHNFILKKASTNVRHDN